MPRTRNVITSYSIHYTKLYDVIISDPESEYSPLVERFGGQVVITSYSIHYTKLYEQIVPKGYYPVPQGQERRFDEEDHMQDEQTIDQLADLASGWMAEDGGMGDVITSYSIHYTKLYDGAAAIAVHGRTREQYYTGKADWDIIRQVKEAVSIPVVGNGDVDSPIRAKQLVEETGCDGIMIGRAVQGNPWIFSQTLSYLNTGMIPAEPDFAEIITTIRRHAKLQLQYKGEYLGIREMRKHSYNFV